MPVTDRDELHERLDELLARKREIDAWYQQEPPGVEVHAACDALRKVLGPS
jgi:hypothetical protein